MIEKMIPLSVIDSKIKEFQDIAKITKLSYERQWVIVSVVIPMLEGLKKQVVPSLEQKVNDRIKELENPNRWEGKKTDLIQNQLDAMMADELRKLLSPK